MSLISEAWAAFVALFSFDPFTIRKAIDEPGAWITGGFAIVIGAFLIVALGRFATRMDNALTSPDGRGLYERLPIFRLNIERFISIWTYLILAAIIFVEVVMRFYGNFETWWTGENVTYSNGWATTVPPLFFLLMAWYGCVYNVRLRTHLSFNEFRNIMPRAGQLFCLTIDFLLWWGFCLIVVVTTARATASSADNFRIVGSTDNVMQWWFYVTIPVAFILLAGRALQNYLDDLRNYRTGEPMIKQAVIGGDV